MLPQVRVDQSPGIAKGLVLESVFLERTLVAYILTGLAESNRDRIEGRDGAVVGGQQNASQSKCKSEKLHKISPTK